MMDQAALHIATRIVFGKHSIDRLGELTRECGGGPALLVTDPGVAAAGHADRAMDSLARSEIDCVLYEGVHENPTTLDVEACLEVARSSNVELLIGLGGGSSIDTARGCNFLLTNGGSMSDYWGVGKAEKPMKPMIAVPTTTGTGSEMQSFALIADAETHQKMACGDKKAAARFAILDPTLSCTQPREVIAHTGLDCIAHAVETAVTTRRTVFSSLFAHESWRLSVSHFRRILDDPSDLESQGRMLLASAYAGIAIEHSMLGAAHAMANPLTARFDIVHGQAVGMMLPHVVRFNSECEAALNGYVRLARAAGLAQADAPESTALDAVLNFIESSLVSTDTPATLAECGVTTDSISTISEEASRQWTGQFNPRPVTEQHYREMYLAALGN